MKKTKSKPKRPCRWAFLPFALFAAVLNLLVLCAPPAQAQTTVSFDSGWHAPRPTGGLQGGAWIDHVYPIPLAPAGTTSMSISYLGETTRTVRVWNHGTVPYTTMWGPATQFEQSIETTYHETWIAPSNATVFTVTLNPGESVDVPLSYTGSATYPINSSHIPAFQSRRAKYSNTWLYYPTCLQINGQWTQSSGGFVDVWEWEQLGLTAYDVWGEECDPEVRFSGTVTYQ